MSSQDAGLYNMDEGGVLQRLGGYTTQTLRGAEGRLEASRAIDAKETQLTEEKESQAEEGLGIGVGTATAFSGVVGLVKKRAMGVIKSKAQQQLDKIMNKVKQRKQAGEGDEGAGQHPPATQDPNATPQEPAPNSGGAEPPPPAEPPSVEPPAIEPIAPRVIDAEAPKGSVGNPISGADAPPPPAKSKPPVEEEEGEDPADAILPAEAPADLPASFTTSIGRGGGSVLTDRPIDPLGQGQPDLYTQLSYKDAPSGDTATQVETARPPPAVEADPVVEPPPSGITAEINTAQQDALGGMRSSLKQLGLSDDDAGSLVGKIASGGGDTEDLLSGASELLSSFSSGVGGVLGALGGASEVLGPLSVVAGIGMGIWGEVKQAREEAQSKIKVGEYQKDLQNLTDTTALQTGSIAMPTLDTSQFRAGGIGNF